MAERTGTLTAPPSLPATPHSSDGTRVGARLARLWRGPDEAAWVRPALLVLLAGTGVLYLWGLGASGWANAFYSAAAQAGSESWKAFFFGASDAAASITVDKTPMSLWVMGLSVRAFGLSSWSILVPQALMGVASVGLLYATVRRSTGSAGAGLLAGLVLATTPVAVLMFRFNNPDALLVLLMVGAAAATLRAVEASYDTGEAAGRAAGTAQQTVQQMAQRMALRWLLLAGALVGFAFLTKMLQAFLVLPAFALVYLLEARFGWGRKLVHLLAAFLSMVVAGGWWVLAVELWPADARPYIGGSQDNSILELTLGYNGLGRLTGEETGSVGGGRGGGWGNTGLLRMFGSDMGGQVAWLLPASLLLLGIGLVLTGRAPRGDGTRAALVAWGGWLVVTALTFSLMAGIFHAYYTVALAPAIGALVGIGTVLLWRRRRESWAGITMAALVALTTSFAVMLMARDDYAPALRWTIAVAGIGVALLLACVRFLDRRAAAVVAAAALVAALAGQTAYAVETATTPHTGSIPSAGPSGSGGFGPGGGPGGGPVAGQGGPFGTQGQSQAQRQTQGGAAGGLLDGSEPSADLVALLTEDGDSYRWAAATVGANAAAGYQLATELSVLPIGGFNGTDPSPTLKEFQQYVANGEIHYFVAGGTGMGAGPGGQNGGQGGGSQEASEIAAWVAETFTAQTVGGVTVYDLSGGVR